MKWQYRSLNQDEFEKGKQDEIIKAYNKMIRVKKHPSEADMFVSKNLMPRTLYLNPEGVEVFTQYFANKYGFMPCEQPDLCSITSLSDSSL